MTELQVGDQVRIGRNEIRHPPRGSWPLFRGRVGTVVEINGDREHPHLTEYGVVFGKVSQRAGRRPGEYQRPDPATWFKPYEVVAYGKAPVAHAEARSKPPAVETCSRR